MKLAIPSTDTTEMPAPLTTVDAGAALLGVPLSVT